MHYFITWWIFLTECWCNVLLICVPFTYQKIFSGYRYTLKTQPTFRHVLTCQLGPFHKELRLIVRQISILNQSRTMYWTNLHALLSDKDCCHTKAKCVIWIIIWVALFELRSVHTRDRSWDFAFQREKNDWVPCQSNMHGARISCASVHMQRARCIGRSG